MDGPTVRELPTQALLLSRFIYDPSTGALTWRETNHRHKAGDRAGWSDGRYIRVCVDGDTFYGHRVVWKMMTGEDPKIVDHEDLDRSNLIWDNIRNGTKSQNQGNRLARSDNTSGHKNIHWDEIRSRWVVQVKNSSRKMARRTRTLAGAIAFRRLAVATLFEDFARI